MTQVSAHSIQQCASIQFERVSFSYQTDNGGTVDVLSEISFSIQAGEFFGVVGPSGCGKTTILRLAADLINHRHIAQQRGSICVHSKSPGVARKERCFGFLFQDSVLFPWRNVLENATLPHQIIGASDDDYFDRVHFMLDRVGLTQFKESRISELSGGMQQRVSLVRALATKPSVLLLDEPFSSLDQIVREQLMELLQELWDETRPTVVFVTHDLSDAVTLCDSVAVLSHRPAQIRDIVQVNMPRPRTYGQQAEPEYIDALDKVRTNIIRPPGGM